MNIHLNKLRKQLKSAGLDQDAYRVAKIIRFASGFDDDGGEDIDSEYKRKEDELLMSYDSKEDAGISIEPSASPSTLARLMEELNVRGSSEDGEVDLVDYISFLERTSDVARFNVPKDQITGTVKINLKKALEDLDQEVIDSDALSWMREDAEIITSDPEPIGDDEFGEDF